MVMAVFHRVLNGDDMLGKIDVDVVDHSCQCGGFPTPGRPGDQDQPSRLSGQLADNGRQAQLLKGRNGVVEQANGSAELILLAVHVNPLSEPCLLYTSRCV